MGATPAAVATSRGEVRLLYSGLGSTWRLEHLVGQGSSENGGGVGQGSVQVRVP